MAVLASVTLEGQVNQKVESAKSMLSLSASKTVSLVSPSSSKMSGSKQRKTARVVVKKLSLVKIREEQGLDIPEISGWAKDKESRVYKRGNSPPAWVK